jgi:Raf kinase inhibitor-like YbhB/YbcL family protein
VAPALTWDAAPAGTQEIAVAMTDLDLPGFVHWVMAGIDPRSTGLGEGEVPEFASVGVNGMGRTAYSGPCTPAGQTHRYQITVYLLAQRTELGDGAAGADLLAAVQGSAFMTAQVTGVYSRP